ncbi:ATP-binding cassette domain-containing protein [Propionibacterium australiense]|uniref:ATP-binding cassette domain-containing protein n=1 Tax=Propionibacterium australiense TaxID=119981 RepID=A0A8B3FKV2_9ACTN|nr:ATP-binding cassette domain-containing protein [Propionibacterium australiense]RLP08761.1 ATP-binding cassette domain-containing protein [Propionibacterium australiense]
MSTSPTPQGHPVPQGSGSTGRPAPGATQQSQQAGASAPLIPPQAAPAGWPRPAPGWAPAPAAVNPRAALSIRGLVKFFGAKCAVAGIDLDVPAGSLFGLVGPNGAGKTTALSMATGLLRPDQGQVLVAGHDVWADPAAAKALMGVLPDGLRTFDRLSGRELLEFVARMNRLDRATAGQRAEQLLVTLGLAGDGDKMVCDYSAGMTKKIGLACALIHNPRLLVLDEPFESVDPVSGETIRQILHRYTAGGGTVVMSSHVMELVETLCDAVAVMAAGRILAAGPTDEVRAGMPLQQRFLQLVGVHQTSGGELSWLDTSPGSN